MKSRAARVTILLLVSAVLPVAAGPVELDAVLYPEAKKVPVTFETTDRAPKAKLQATVTIQAGQAGIDISWSKLEPALLFGGDINCWVMWVMTPDGLAVSLGELPVREDRSGKARFSTPYKNFAMIVTAEPLPIVRKPGELVAFRSLPTSDKMARNSKFSFSDFRTTYSAHDVESIANLKYTDKTPIDLQQARRAIGLMDRVEAEKYAAQPARDARVALGQADDAYAGRVGKKEDVPELSRRATELASQAVRAAGKGVEAQQAKDTEAKRLSELAALEAQTEAEKQARRQVETALADVEKQRQALQVEVGRVQTEKTKVEADRAKVTAERDLLAKRLSGALSQVSETASTGRGLVVSLSGGILFDTGKSNLKANAKVVLAKLAGILLMIPDTKITIEGHTDATGSLETNEKLSRERAVSVMDFLKSQGLADGRMTATGLGPAQPVAPNDTAEGRAKNRRVEIVVPHEAGAGQAAAK